MFKKLVAIVATIASLNTTPAFADQNGDAIGAFIGGAILGGIFANNNRRYVQPLPEAYVYDVRPRYREVYRPRYYNPPVRYYSSPNCVLVEVYYDDYGNEHQRMNCY